MSNESEILGCFVSGPTVLYNIDQFTKDKMSEQGKLFRSYIWGEKGIDNTLKKLKQKDYGKDLMLVLFQFYVNPLPAELQNLKEMEGYRKREKSIGMAITVTKDNFFDKSDKDRYSFLKQCILEKLDELAETVSLKKLDTNIGALKADLLKALSHFSES